jgi:hypothetical protein
MAPVSVRLRPMREDEYDAFYADGVEESAGYMVKNLPAA